MRGINIVLIIALLTAIMIMPVTAFEPGECDIEVHPGDSLDAKVDSATDGQTVCVYAGTYKWFSINTPNITLKGEGADVVTLDCGGTRSAIGNEAPAPGCIVDGLKIVNSDQGIEVNSGSPDCIVRNCVFEGLTGNYGPLLGSSNITFENNVIKNSAVKYCLLKPTKGSCTIANNIIKDNPMTGGTARATTLRDTASNCTFVNNTIVNNTGAGIRIYKATATNNTIYRNNISSNTKGIWIYKCGSDPLNNKIYLNDIVDNTETVVYTKTTPPNIWNSTEQIEYVYNGSTYTNYLGNYWGSDYTGPDGDGDGIGNLPYPVIGTDMDYRPLMAGFENYPAPAPAPDLIPTSLTPTTLYANQSNEITATIKNNGTGDAGAFNVSLKVEENVIDNETVTSLGASSSTDVLFTWTPTSTGAFNLTVTADPESVIAESNETNNNLTVQANVIEALAPPALNITSWHPLETTVTDYENVSRTFNISVNQTVNVRWLINGTEVFNQTDVTESEYTNTSAAVGIWNISAIAINENGTAMQTWLWTVLKKPDLPDLIITNIRTPVFFYVGQKNTIGVTVENNGTANAGSFNVSLDVEGTVLAKTIPLLLIGANTTLKFEYTPLVSGSYKLNATADPENLIKELNETNNWMVKFISAIEEARDDNWYQFQKDEINAGITYSPAPTEDPELAWSAFTYGSEWGNGIDVTPIIAGDLVYVYVANGSIWAFDKTSGDLIWKNETTGGNLQTSTPAYGDGKIFVAANSGDLFAFNATTGKELWNVHVTDKNFECPITYFDHKIYIGVGLEGGITTKYYYCYDDNGTFVWKYAVDNTSGFLWCGASVVGDYLVFGTHEGKLISLYKNNGTLTDEVDLTSELSFSRADLGKIRASVTYHEGYIYTTSEKGQPVGYVWKVGFDADNGTFVDDGWSTANGFSTSTPVVYDGKVYVGQGEHGFTGNLTCLNDSTGEIIWSYFVDAGVKSSPALSIQGEKPYIYFTGAKSDGALYCLKEDGTLAWVYNPPDDGYILQGAAISEGKVYFGTDGGYIYCLKVKRPSTIYVPDDYPTIQEAVNNATAGNTIIVRDGTYTENVVVDKSLAIKSENGSDSTTVHTPNPKADVFSIPADDVTIDGFTITGATSTSGCPKYYSGVQITGKQCYICNNNISGNRNGVQIYGYEHPNCHHNVIANNTIPDSIYAGIKVRRSSNNVITNNTVLNSGRSYPGPYNRGYNIWLDAGYLRDSTHDNIVINNNIVNGGEVGVFLQHYADDNKIYLNNFFDNTRHIESSDSSSLWNSAAKATYGYHGTTYTNNTGNYFDNYGGSDADGDGIGDISYSSDHYPLVEPFENYQIITQTDLVPISLQSTTLYLQTNVITATISNMGLVDAGEFNVSFSVEGTVIDTIDLAGLTGGSSTTVSFTWTPSEPGYVELCVLADCDDEVVETNETNNERCENVTVEEPEPDLTSSKITLKTPGYVGEENILGVTVENIGAENAGSFNVTLEVDGTQLGEQNIPSLDAWMSIELEFAWTPIHAGEYVLTATADSNDDIEESNETNNNLTKTLVIVIMNDWTQFHYDAAHVGFSTSKAPNTNETLWISEDICAVASSSTVVAEGKVFVNCGDSLTALNEYTGEVLWSSPAGVGGEGGSWSSPTYHDGRAFISGEGAYSAADGSKIWDGLPGNTNGGPLVVNGRVFIGDWGGHHYYCFDEETGEELWNFTVSGYAQGTPAYADEKVFLTSWPYGSGGYVYCVDSDTGTEIWSTHTNSEACGSPTVSDGIVYATTFGFYGPGEIYALNTTNGSILWQKTIQRTDSTPAAAYGNVYVCGGCPGFSDLQTYCFNATTGELIWNTTASEEGIGSWTCSVAVADGKVFVGKMSGTGMSFDYAGTYALDAFTGDIIWSYPEGGSSPAVADGMVFTIGGGKVYAFGGAAPPAPPNIISWNPVEAIVDDTEGAARTFNITVNQTVNVSWLINGTKAFNQTDVTGSEYTNMSAAVGTWNVSTIATNPNGTAVQTWIWNVTIEAPSPCFIATAAYGTPLHEDIDVLRDFRDEYLMTNPVGSTFVKIYYTTSPPIADVIRENEGLRTIVRAGLVKPLVYISRVFVR